MPIYEYTCPIHGKFERIMPINAQIALCERFVPVDKNNPDVVGSVQCGETCQRVEWSVPSKRSSRYGEGET